MRFKRSFLLLLAVVAASCRHAAPQDHPAAPAKPHGALVARVGQVELHEDDLERMMARDPGASPHRFDGDGARRELVDGMVRFELLAQAAERAGLMQDPDAIHAQQQIAVTKLVNEKLGAAASPESITREDVAREYAARRATDFTLPPAARVRHVRVSDAALASRVATEAKALAPEDDAAFARLATKMSEDTTTRAAGGDLGFIDAKSRLAPALVEAALKLRVPGEVAGPLEIAGSYEILRLVSLRAALVSPLSSVEEPLRQRLYQERRAKALEDFIAQLRAETRVEMADAKPPAFAGAR